MSSKVTSVRLFIEDVCEWLDQNRGIDVIGMVPITVNRDGTTSSIRVFYRPMR